MKKEERKEELRKEGERVAGVIFRAIHKEYEEGKIGMHAVLVALCELSASALHFVATEDEDSSVIDFFIESLLDNIEGRKKADDAQEMADDIIDRLKNK